MVLFYWLKPPMNLQNVSFLSRSAEAHRRYIETERDPRLVALMKNRSDSNCLAVLLGQPVQNLNLFLISYCFSTFFFSRNSGLVDLKDGYDEVFISLFSLWQLFLQSSTSVKVTHINHGYDGSDEDYVVDREVKTTTTTKWAMYSKHFNILF